MRRLANLFSLLLLASLVMSACASSSPTPAQQPSDTTAAPAAAAEPTAAPAAAAEPTAAPAAASVATAAPATTTESVGTFSESPALAQQVKDGKLPAVADRLPKNPQVIKPLVEEGQYGGTLRQGIVGSSVTWGGMLYTTQWENLVQWKTDFNDVEPSIAEKIDISPDGREYTFTLRQGMKWSDGEPFGPDDILFYINDVLLDKELSPGGPTADWLPSTQAEGLKAEKVGESGVKITFPKPYGSLLLTLATWGGRQFAQYPKHYLQQFHKKYNPNVDELVKQDNTLKDWTGLFFKKGPDSWGNPDRFMDVPEYPSLGPWVVTQPLGSGTVAKFTRNPYYWKVDDQGRQLPYVDDVTVTSYQDEQTATLAMLNGDFDYIKSPAESNREVYFDAMDQGKPIKVLQVKPDGGNVISVHFNQASKNPTLREIFSSKDFRIGMSYAINRDEIIEAVFKGQGTPAQVSPLEDSPLYNEKLSTQYLEYDTAKANESLDKVLPKKGADGMRLAPDGKPLQLIWTALDSNYTGGDAKAWLQAAELMVGYFKAVGVDVKLDVISDQVFTERRKTNDVDMFIFHGGEGGAGLTAIIDPRWHVPGEFWGIFGLGWYVSMSGATPEEKANGIEMPQKDKDERKAFQEAIQQPTRDGLVSAMKKVLDTSADEFWTIGIARPGMGYQPISTKIGNYPETSIGGWLPGVTKIVRPEQWYIKS